jgi:hypothetical protein
MLQNVVMKDAIMMLTLLQSHEEKCHIAGKHT